MFSPTLWLILLHKTSGKEANYKLSEMEHTHWALYMRNQLTYSICSKAHRYKQWQHWIKQLTILNVERQQIRHITTKHVAHTNSYELLKVTHKTIKIKKKKERSRLDLNFLQLTSRHGSVFIPHTQLVKPALHRHPIGGDRTNLVTRSWSHPYVNKQNAEQCVL